MAEPRVLVLDDSFIRPLRLLLSRDFPHFSFDFQLSHRALISLRSRRSCSIDEELRNDFPETGRAKVGARH